MTDDRDFSTRLLHLDDTVEQAVNPRATPIYLTAGYVFDDFDHAAARFAGTDAGYVYSRNGNPTVAAVERRIAGLEGGTDAVLVASGQAAITLALTVAAGAGDHVLASPSLYGGTRGLLVENLPRLGIASDLVDDPSDPDSWERGIRPETRALFLESIPNARNDVVDIAAVAAVAHRNGIPLIVDNTFATPALLRPFEHGADVVVHSTSKFLTGNGTALGGVVVDSGRFDWAADPGRYPHLTGPSYSLRGDSFARSAGPTAAYSAYLRSVAAARFGPTPSPVNAFLLLQGIETLAVRVARQSASALALAEWLETQDVVEGVDYSGLASSPHHAVASRLLPDGQGSVFTFTLRGGEPAARIVHDGVRLFTRMTHIGDVRSLILHPRSTTHTLHEPAELDALGVHEGTLRLSIGLEDPGDLIRDLDRAFALVREHTGGVLPAETAPTTGKAA